MIILSLARNVMLEYNGCIHLRWVCMGLNIRQKILLAFILVILVSGGAVFTIYSNSEQIVELTNQIIDENMVNTHNIQKMRELLLHTDWALSRYQLPHESP